MRKSTLLLSVLAVLALCMLAANFPMPVSAQRGAPPAPNNTCPGIAVGNAIGTVSRTRFNTTGATRAANDPCISCCFFGVGQNDKSIWYSTTPPANAVVRVSTQGSDYDTVVAVYRRTGNTCPTGGPNTSACTNAAGVTEVVCNDDSGGTLQSDVAFVANGTSTYFIEVAECTGTANGFGGTAVVNISINPR